MCVCVCPQKLAESDQRSQELADFNAVLAGHANHHQKVMYMKKIQTDYNTIKEVGFGVSSMTVSLSAVSLLCNSVSNNSS